MQFIERSSFGVRAAVYDLRHPASPIQVVLFPVIHVAEPGFYVGVRERLRTCTTVILEGMAGGLAYYLTLTYRLLGQLGRLGLVSQSTRELLAGSSAEVILADMTQAEFQASWKTLPFRARLLFLLLVPVVGLVVLTGGSREVLVPGSVEDLPCREDILGGDDDTDALDRVLLADRDTRLLTVLDRCIDAHWKTAARVGVVYGAAHMPAVVRRLYRLGFHVNAADWLPVMGFGD